MGIILGKISKDVFNTAVERALASGLAVFGRAVDPEKEKNGEAVVPKPPWLRIRFCNPDPDRDESVGHRIRSDMLDAVGTPEEIRRRHGHLLQDPLYNALTVAWPSPLWDNRFPVKIPNQGPKSAGEVIEAIRDRTPLGNELRRILWEAAALQPLGEDPNTRSFPPKFMDPLHNPPWTVIVAALDSVSRNKVVKALKTTWPEEGGKWEERFAVVPVEREPLEAAAKAVENQSRTIVLMDSLTLWDSRENGALFTLKDKGVEVFVFERRSSLGDLTLNTMVGETARDGLFLKYFTLDKTSRQIAAELWSRWVFDEEAEACLQIFRSQEPPLSHQAWKWAQWLLRGRLSSVDFVLRPKVHNSLAAHLGRLADKPVYP